MLKFFKKKLKSKPEVKLDSIYSELVSDTNIAKLKVDLVKNISTIRQTLTLSEQDKKLIISSLLDKLPILAKESIASNKNTVYFFSHMITIRKFHKVEEYGGIDALFQQIADDFFAVLETMKLEPEMMLGKTAISLKVNKLMKFCNFEKLASLK